MNLQGVLWCLCNIRFPTLLMFLPLIRSSSGYFITTQTIKNVVQTLSFPAAITIYYLTANWCNFCRRWHNWRRSFGYLQSNSFNGVHLAVQRDVFVANVGFLALPTLSAVVLKLKMFAEYCYSVLRIRDTWWSCVVALPDESTGRIFKWIVKSFALEVNLIALILDYVSITSSLTLLSC